MNRNLVLLAFLIFSLLPPIPTQSTWLKENFPNPIRDTRKCGRRGVVSWICDPDEVVPYEEANILEEMLQNVGTKTKSGCSVDPQRPGFQVGIAVMNEMEVPSEMTKEEVAKDFARHLHSKWGVGSAGCDDGVLLLLSVKDRQIYVSTGRTAKKLLTDGQIDIIIDEMKPILVDKQYGKALNLATERMHQVFDGKILRSKHYFAVICILVFLAFFLGFVIYKAYQSRQYESCQEKLNRIERERNAAKKSKKYVSSSCPICLEDFTPEMRTRLLLCGHKYCEPCLKRWLETNSTCPICRQSTNRRENENEDENMDSSRTLEFFPELTFRLLNLQRQYPSFITEDLIHHWTSQQFQGSFVEDSLFTVMRPIVSSSSGTFGSLGSGSGFGGGGTSDGGGSGGSW